MTVPPGASLSRTTADRRRVIHDVRKRKTQPQSAQGLRLRVQTQKAMETSNQKLRGFQPRAAAAAARDRAVERSGRCEPGVGAETALGLVSRPAAEVRERPSEVRTAVYQWMCEVRRRLSRGGWGHRAGIPCTHSSVVTGVPCPVALTTGTGLRSARRQLITVCCPFPTDSLSFFLLFLSMSAIVPWT